MSLGDQLPLSFAHRPASGLEDFLPASCNQAALGWIERWPDWPAPGLLLWGPEASGKSHLARIWAARARATPLGPDLLARALELPAGAAYVLDPAWPLSAELPLLQLYNRLKEAGGHLLLTARRPAAAWDLGLADLRSRLCAAPTALIGPPDDGLLSALLIKQFDDRQLKVPAAVVSYLVQQMERSFAMATRLVGELDALSLARQRPITVPLARIALTRAGNDPARPD